MLCGLVARADDKFMLRFPDGMRSRVLQAAAANGRSMNAEVIQRLEWSFAAEAAPRRAVREIRDEVSLREAREEYSRFTKLLERVEGMFDPAAQSGAVKKTRGA